MKIIYASLFAPFALLALFALSACAPNYISGQATGTARPHKVGKAKCVNVLYFFDFGDCTILKAAKNGEIEDISTVDFVSSGIKYIYTIRTTIVSGE